ncbi:MFS transporter [Trichophyton equinum CBS 127.97]|uniref:MFS transporter n=1 Tax=Trichophyton equinum (strain ATCC MYA-4606 / CBS 127.97) TaxID=559882 RepID=F2PU34_TRIEC|nr:MFS transporter [Trichophyton equinum CBS 127.97]
MPEKETENVSCEDGGLEANANGGAQDMGEAERGHTQGERKREEEAIYSAFKPGTKIFILVMATFSSLFSPVSTTIYLPALTPISADLKVSTNLINLTLTTYMTCRNVVGDGSVQPPWWWSRTLMDIWKGKGSQPSKVEWEASLADQGIKRRKSSFPNPLQCARLVLEKDIGLILGVTAVLYGAFYVMLTSVPSLFKEIYGLNEFQVGLCYLPSAAGGIASSFSIGHLLDWKFRRIATSLGLPVDRKRAQSLKEFPIERARISLMLPLLYAGMATMVGYGWALEQKVMLAGPLILQFVTGFCTGSAFTAMSTLLVDLGSGGNGIVQPSDRADRNWLVLYGVVSVDCGGVSRSLDSYPMGPSMERAAAAAAAGIVSLTEARQRDRHPMLLPW